MDVEGDGADAWQYRVSRVREVLAQADADVWGFQEPFLHQVRDVSQMLPEWKWVGVGRGDGAELDEFNPIFVRPGLEILEWNTRWISTTPEVPGSMFDGAGCPRLITSVRLRWEGRELWMLNTHFDHLSHQARLHGIKQIAELVATLGSVVITGDFNCDPLGPDFDSWRELGMKDLLGCFASELPGHTYHGFGLPETEWQRIDSIWVSSDIRIENAQASEQKFWGASDHVCLLAEISL
ncbi:MAG: endonuclease/exonuclease/phosphatase family protein [Armatimonadetes bacterium]|nr:endonuclease/exonuclease/phosphatase family protein [Armatimonadota bacterium]